MSKISTYPSAETPLLLSDRLIGTEAFRPVPSPTPLATKNFSLGELLQLFSANFPAASLQDVLNSGNTATQNIDLIGTISSTLIKPVNIEDTSGSQGTTFQFLSKGASSINWVNLPVDNLQAVLNSGNTATQNITLIGNITSTRVIPGNIQDDTASIGTTGQVLSKTATGIRWINNPAVYTAGLNDVLSVGNTATNNITLIGDINATNAKITGAIYDSNNSPGTAGQILSSTVTGTDWIDLSLTGYVPYTGATSDLNLNTKNIFANEFNFWDPAYSVYGKLYLDAEEFTFMPSPSQVIARLTYGQLLLQGISTFNATITYTTLTNNRSYALPNASGTIALTSDIPTAVTSVSATSPITSSGGTTPTISTSMATNKLIGRSTAGTGVMEEITVGTGLTLSAGTLSTTSTGGGIPHATASGTDTYTATIVGVTSYADADAYLIRFTNGNTTGATLNINGLGAIPLYENNNGPLIGGDIWDNGEMLCVYNATLNIFQCIGTSSNSLFAYVTNADTVPITKGQPVYAFGGTGDRLTVKRASCTSDATSARTIGVVSSSSIGVNQKGFIIIEGLLDGLNILPTATWSDGDTVYLGTTAGSITNIKQYAPNHLVYLGTVTTASNGSSGRWYVKVQNGYELDELHNVQAQSPNLNDTLWYDSTVTPGQWKTASIPTILGYTPVTNARTISTTSPLQGGGDLTADRTLSILQSSAIQNGYLSSTDWSTFNSKFTLPSLTSGSVLFSNGTTIAQDNANFFWDDTNNRLGIGTTSPSAKLHVNGSMYLEDTATSVESITFSQGPQIVSDGPSGYFRTGQVYTNTITSNVGIGTSTPAYKLNLYGNAALYNIGTNAAIAANKNYFVGHGLDASTPANITSKIGFVSDAPINQFSDAIAFYTTPTTFSPVNSDASTERMRITNSGNVGIGTASPNASAILDLTSTTQGLLIPRMTTSERNAIASPDTGLIVYDTTLLSLYQYNGTAWVAVGGGGGGSTPVKLTSQTLTAASWTLSGGYYTYAFSNVNVTTTCDVSVTPQNASYQTAYNANVLPFVGVAAGVATFYAQFPPAANMVVDIVITQTT